MHKEIIAFDIRSADFHTFFRCEIHVSPGGRYAIDYQALELPPKLELLVVKLDKGPCPLSTRFIATRKLSCWSICFVFSRDQVGRRQRAYTRKNPCRDGVASWSLIFRNTRLYTVVPYVVTPRYVHRFVCIAFCFTLVCAMVVRALDG